MAMQSRCSFSSRLAGLMAALDTRLPPPAGHHCAAGLPSGKVHIEYTDILAARKALRLARSLLLDRPVHVRAKALRRF
jgi:hypothetical protein